MIKNIPVKTFSVNYICDECNKGRMIYTGKGKGLWNYKFQHRCKKCRAEIYLDDTFPKVRYEALNTD